jgi:type III secretion protein L
METLAVLNTANAGIEPALGRVVIRGSEYLVYCTAEDLLAKARTEAARILENTRKEADNIREQGFLAGREEAIAAQSRIISDIAAKGESYLAEMEDKIISLVMVAIRRVIGEMDDHARVSRVVRNALSVVQRQNRVSIRVAPSMAESVKADLESILLPYPLIHMAEVTPDDSLDNNDCILETRVGTVKASLEGQLKALQSAVEQAFKGRTQSISGELRRLERSVMTSLAEESPEESGASDDNSN